MYHKLLCLVTLLSFFSCSNEIEKASIILNTKPIQTDHCLFEISLIEDNYLLKYTLYKNIANTTSIINEETLLKTDSTLIAKEELKIWVEEIAFDQDITCKPPLSEENIPIKLETHFKHSDDSSSESITFCSINLEADNNNSQIIPDKIITLFKQKFDLEEYLEALGYKS